MESSLLLCISFIVFLTAPLLHAAEAAEPSDHGSTLQDILILNSYHPGYAWSDDEQAGIIDLFRAKDKNWLPVIEYLDLQRLPDGRHLTELKQLFSLKYQYKKFPVVIAIDNPALEFAIDNQAELFRNAPIVFCGINNYTPSPLKGRSDVTGIVEAIDIAETIEVMLRLHPATQEIFSPQDYTATGLAVRKELEALVPRFGAKVRFRFTDPLTMEELLKELERLPKNSLVLEMGFITDKSGRTFGISEITKLFSEHSPVPIYSTYEQQLGFGIVGGKLLSARIHGTNAARIALRVLAGEKASAIPVVLESDSQFMFDYKVMSRFGIPLSALPEGSTVINKPASFYTTHRVVIQTALGIIGFMAVVISLLTINIIQRRRSSKVIRRSEELFKVITSSTPDHLMVQDKDLRYSFVMNPQPGLTEQDMIGKTDYDFLSKEDADKLTEIKRQVLKTGRPAHVEVPLTSSTQGQQFFEGSYIPKFDVKSQVDGLIGYFRNVTERKEAAEALRKSQEKLIEAHRLAHIGVWNWVAETDTVIWTEELYRIAGLDPMLPAPTYAEHSNIYAPESWDLLKEAVERAMKTGEPYNLELKLIRPDGTTRLVNAFGGATYDNHGRIEGLQGTVQDITERKRAEEALRHQNEMLRTILDSIPVMVALFDREGHYEWVNRVWQSTLGWSLEEMLQHKDVFAELYPDPAYRKYVVDCIAAAAGTWSDFKTRTHDGRVIDTSWVNVPLSDGSNIGIGIDITERKQAEEALRRAEENFRLSLDDSPLGMRIVTIEGETIYANRAILDFYGCDSIEELRTTPLKERYSPESYAEFQIRKEKRKRGDYYPSEYDISIVRKNGEVRHLHVFRKEIVWDGERQYQVIYNDTTEHKQAEEELKRRENLLQKIFDVLPVGLWLADKDGKLLRGNSAGMKIWGAESKVGPYEYGIFKARRLPSKEEIEPEDWALAHTMREKITVVDEMLEIDAFDGKKKVILNYTAPVLDDQGAIQGAIVVNLDITERMQAEKVLRASREQMRALAGRLQEVREEERTLIAREIHDELGGALTGLKIDVSLLTRVALKIENETVRTSLLAHMDSMIKFTDATIQTVRRIAMELRPGVLDDLGLVAALEWQLKDFETRTGIRCEFFPSVEDISFDADLSTALFRIFQEALTNVVRHSEATEVRVRLRADADSCTLEVEDNGKGIEKEKTMSSKSLGLLGMRERAQMFGGRITVTGTPGRGTIVTVEIPPEEKRKMDRDQEGAAG